MLSVVMLTKNCEETLFASLSSLEGFAEVIVYDTGSTDTTLCIAREFANVKVVEGDSLEGGFGPTRNRAADLATYDWIFVVDSDEVVSEALAQELFALDMQPGMIYQIQRHNFFNGKWIRHCGGWHPDPVLRLYHRKTTQFSEHAVHEKLLVQGCLLHPLRSPLLHTPYRSIDQLLSKMQLYSTLFSRQCSRQKGGVYRALLHSMSAFCKSYLFKRGFLGGQEGLIISLYNAHTTFYKYLKLMELKK